MQTESVRARAMNDTRNRILDVALEALGQNPEAGMGDIATAAGVVRRTVYGHFPTRADLVQTLARRAVDEMMAVLTAANAADAPADEAWVDFVTRLWPLTRRYRLILALRRGEYGRAIHALLEPVDKTLTDLVQRGQDSHVFGSHLPAGILSQLAYAAVFSIADFDLSNGGSGPRAAIITSLLILGVPEERSKILTGG